MDYKLLQLNFSQLETAWKRTKNNEYSDFKKSAYQEKLTLLFKQMKEEDLSMLSPQQVVERSSIYDFFFLSLTFLDGSTISQIPFEIVKFLEEALKEWLNDHEDFIIVTSLVTGVTAFSFDSRLTFRDDFYEIIEKNYNITFESRLIQINVPEYLTRDYLANVVLYHELGHFIDRKFRISSSCALELLDRVRMNKINPTQLPQLIDFFPVLGVESSGNYTFQVLNLHLAEYFCDLFASQYVAGSSNHYLEYITKGSSGWSTTHPSTPKRVEIVDDFMKGNSNFVLDLIEEATVKASKKGLSKRFIPFVNDDFVNLVPVNVGSIGELHYLFIYGWDLWLGKWSELENRNKMAFPLAPNQTYEIINNLIEKSIGNYIVSSNWDKQRNVSAESRD